MYVFPGRDPKRPPRESQRVWHAESFAAGLDDPRLHDLRHSVASFAAAPRYSMYLIGQLLGRKPARSAERYSHTNDDARKVMADRSDAEACRR